MGFFDIICGEDDSDTSTTESNAAVVASDPLGG